MATTVFLGVPLAVPPRMCRGEDGGMVCLLEGTGEGGVIGPEVIGRHLHWLLVVLVGSGG